MNEWRKGAVAIIIALAVFAVVYWLGVKIDDMDRIVAFQEEVQAPVIFFSCAFALLSATIILVFFNPRVRKKLTQEKEISSDGEYGGE